MSKINGTNGHSSRRSFLAGGVGLACAGAWSSLLGSRGGRAQEAAGTVHQDITQATTKARLSMLFEGRTAVQCRTWQKAFRAKLEELLGDSTPPKRWTAREESRVELEDHVRFELLLEADRVPAVPLYLLLPKSVQRGRRLPAVLCVHGHGNYGHHPLVGRTDLEGVADHIQRSNYDYGLQFVRRGYVVAAPCMIPFGRRVDRDRYQGEDPCAVTFVRMQALGQLPMRANLRDLRWTLDLLQSRNEVDPERLGCAGLSYGGRMTMLATAMDQRIGVASVSGALNLLQERMTLRHSCGSQIIPGLLRYGDYSEIGSLIAPRPCVWETGSEDRLIVPEWDEVFRSRLRRAYAALQASDKLHFDRFEGGHQWSGRVAMPLFDRVLQRSV